MLPATEIPDHVRAEMDRRIEAAKAAYESIKGSPLSGLLTREAYLDQYVKVNFPPLTWTSSTARVAPA